MENDIFAKDNLFRVLGGQHGTEHWTNKHEKMSADRPTRANEHECMIAIRQTLMYVVNRNSYQVTVRGFFYTEIIWASWRLF